MSDTYCPRHWALSGTTRRSSQIFRWSEGGSVVVKPTFPLTVLYTSITCGRQVLYAGNINPIHISEKGGANPRFYK